MDDRLTAEIERIRSDTTIPTLDEDNVKRVVIEPILKELGWNIYDTREFRSEYNLSGGKVDYALHLEDEPNVFLEAKNPREELGKHQRQLLEYAFEKGSPLAVLTNGLEWWLYLASASVDWEKRRFSVIDLRNPDVSQTTDSLIDFLSRENVRSGYAVGYAESLLITLWEVKKIEETLPRAWTQLIAEPHDQLLALLNQKVMELCGLGANQDQIKRFLANLPKPTPAPLSSTPSPLQSLKTKHPNQSLGSYNGTRIASFTFHGQTYGARPWTKMLIALADQIYQLHSSEFQKVLELRGTKRPYFSHNQQGMRKARPIGNSGYFAETDLTPGQIVHRCHALLATFGYREQDLRIETT